MNIVLNNEDVTQALEEFVKNRMNIEDNTLSINISTTRNPTGYTATVDLIAPDSIAAGPEMNSKVPEPVEEVKVEEVPEPPKRKRRTKAEIEADKIEENADPFEGVGEDTPDTKEPQEVAEGVVSDEDMDALFGD